MTRRGALCAGVVMVAASLALSAAQLKTPPEWKWRTDAPAEVTDKSGTGSEPGKVFFVAMPPGWHVTSGPGTLLYHPDYQGKGNFTLEMEAFLFADASDQEYGVFIGGRGLEPSATPRYTAFVLRRDGRAAVLGRAGDSTTAVVDWMVNSAALPLAAGSKDDVKNVLRVDVGATSVVFSANGKEITKVARADVASEGLFGFRVGKGVNLHASQLR